jgi:hypothetical protein
MIKYIEILRVKSSKKKRRSTLLKKASTARFAVFIAAGISSEPTGATWL